jgi:lipopolysaccharide biosynthesis regulator YciM
LASGDIDRARTAYMQASKASDVSLSLGAIGLADIAMYQGNYAEAISALPAGVQRDRDERNAVGAVAKLLALAEAYAASNRWPEAYKALEEARTLSQDDNVLVTTARLSAASGRIDQAKQIAAALAQRLPPQSRAYGKMIEAEIALTAKQFPVAIDSDLEQSRDQHQRRSRGQHHRRCDGRAAQPHFRQYRRRHFARRHADDR